MRKIDAKNVYPDVDEADQALWQEYTKHITPLRPTNKVQIRNQPNTNSRSSSPRLLLSRYIQTPEAIDPDIPTIRSTEQLFFCKPGFEYDLQELRHGGIAIRGRIDLHGHHLNEAYRTLERFLEMALTRRWHAVCIIHGKARDKEPDIPILKNQLNQWLRSIPEILAFVSAPEREGGSGALYVLLKVGNRHA